MALKWYDTVADMRAMAKQHSHINVSTVYSGPYPLVLDGAEKDATGTIVEGPRQQVELVNARVYKVTVGSDDYDSVMLCRLKQDGTPEWSFYCGDHQVRGKYTSDGKTLADKLRKDGVGATALANRLEQSEWVKQIPDAQHCSFFANFKRTGKICSHTEAMLHNANPTELEAMATELTDWRAGKPIATARVPKSAEEAAVYDVAFIKPAFLGGERGAGKTYIARQLADDFDAEFIEMQMHPAMESWEFFSHDRSMGGKVYTVKGPFARAAEAILKRGKKVVLVMDEFLNMNPVYATVVNSPLTLTSKDTYVLHTGNLIVNEEDGTAVREEVEVPADMLWVVATSNIGARYGVDKMVPSVRARFRVILMNTNPDRTKSIVESTLKKYDMPQEIAEKFKVFLEQCNQAVDQSTLDEEATTRLACDVVRAVAIQTKRDGKHYDSLRQWLEPIRKQLMAEITQVVSFELGELDATQEATYKALVDATFK
ncbi:AAA family ATPase [Paraburkholderia sp. EG287A]|uniref:AAA family ATPase n=1 Tax=Paraburkholderia sp. EG287A TaxID=3237012 RepID=UPI0034D24405